MPKRSSVVKVRGELRFWNVDVVRSLMPDNLEGMETIFEGDSAVIRFEVEKMSSAIAVVDDILLNAKVAQDIFSLRGRLRKDAMMEMRDQ